MNSLRPIIDERKTLLIQQGILLTAQHEQWDGLEDLTTTNLIKTNLEAITQNEEAVKTFAAQILDNPQYESPINTMLSIKTPNDQKTTDTHISDEALLTRNLSTAVAMKITQEFDTLNTQDIRQNVATLFEDNNNFTLTNDMCSRTLFRIKHALPKLSHPQKNDNPNNVVGINEAVHHPPKPSTNKGRED